MSDIIYTPPASGGGGTTINPTNNFIPKRSNATTFVDSVLENGSNYLYSNYGGYTGLGLDFANFKSYLGDWNNLINGTTLVIDDQTSNIYTKYNASAIGISLNFISNIYTFGDTGANRLYIDGNNQYTQIWLGGFQYLLLDALNQVGSFLDYANGTGFEINGIAKYFNLIISNSNVLNADYAGTGNLIIGTNQAQIKCGTSTSITTLGDINAFGNNTIINIDDTNNEIYLKARVGNGIFLDYSTLKLQGPTSPTSSGPADHLEVEVNGNPYKIQLLNP